MPLQLPVAHVLNFACTLTQFGTAIGTTIPAIANTTVIKGGNQFQGIIQGASAATSCNYTYDGIAWLTFFGIDTPVNSQTFYNNTVPALIATLTSALAGTLGAPVPTNIAQNPSYAGNI